MTSVTALGPCFLPERLERASHGPPRNVWSPVRVFSLPAGRCHARVLPGGCDVLAPAYRSSAHKRRWGFFPYRNTLLPVGVFSAAPQDAAASCGAFTLRCDWPQLGTALGPPHRLPAHSSMKRGQAYIQPSGGRSAGSSDIDDLLGLVVRICDSASRLEDRLEHANWALGAGRKRSIAAARLDRTP